MIISNLVIHIETCTLEDGSFWIRCTDSKSGEWLEWRKVDD